jgi:hypothetical protein
MDIFHRREGGGQDFSPRIPLFLFWIIRDFSSTGIG